ncbi:MAG: hypothetical protein Q7J16_05485, partial [Candidatus Cloacimonadales bacterium]|nr:hypothetical protein [Candidatus Cloacimonadales bacterium]
DGVHVDSSGDNGVYVYNAGTPTTQTGSIDKNGFQVNGAQGNGLYVGRADLDGVKVGTTGLEGVYVYNAGADGFSVFFAGDDGVSVGSAVGDGVNVYQAGDDGVYANTTSASNEYGIYTPDKIYAGAGYYPSKMGTFGRNTGSSALKPGDLVCISGGYEENVLGEGGIPVINIEKADSRNSAAIFGVVEYKVYVREEIEEIEEMEEGRTEVQKSFRHADGDAMQGDYLSIIVFGPADVKVNGEVKTGESVIAGDGYARKIKTTEINGITIAENTGVIGKALEDSRGSGMLKVFVNCK